MSNNRCRLPALAVTTGRTFDQRAEVSAVRWLRACGDYLAVRFKRGRGALSNESSRFDRERRIRTTDGWETAGVEGAGADDDLPPVALDPLELEIAVTNLVTNACDAMRGQGEKAAQKPWEASEGLEWEVPSPAPFHTFENPPKLDATATRVIG